ncbi:MAG TPA: T9SS type A sorting domain-containing protein [Bacteroidales bacterium]|nr:T9SS type A sorting domain-containing protein [Bacteroidales bacterium]
MKKFYLLMIAALLGLTLNNASAQVFQSGFETWTSVAPIVPTDWFGSKTSFVADSIAQYTSNPHQGTNACKLKNRLNSNKRLTTQNVAIDSGKTYQMTFWIKGHGLLKAGYYKGLGTSGNNYVYNSTLFDTVNTNTWIQKSFNLTADTTSAAAQFIILVKLTQGDLEDIQVDDVNIDTVTAIIQPADTVSIYDIQYSTAANFPSAYEDSTVVTSGVVTAICTQGMFIQSGFGPWNGLYIYSSPLIASSGVQQGDSVYVTGKVDEYFQCTELTNISSINIIGSGYSYPPYDITLLTEELEGVLVKISNAKVIAPPDYGMYPVTATGNDADSVKVHDLCDTTLYLVVNNFYDITGPVHYSFDEYRILSIDYQETDGISENGEQSFSIYPNPVSTNLFINDIDGINQVNIVDLLGATVATVNVNGNNARLNVANLQPGIYFVTLLKQNVIAGKARFIKE